MPLSEQEEFELLSLKRRRGMQATPNPEEYEPSPMETGLAALAPKGIASAAYGAREALDAPWGKKIETYRKQRDIGRGLLEQSEKTNPKAAMAGNIGRGLLEGLAAGPFGTAGYAAQGGLEAAMESGADLTRGEIGKLGNDVGYGTAMGGILGAAGEYIPETVGANLKSGAGYLAEKATGATRAMAEKFKPGSGEELLKRGIVRFGSSAKDIARRSQQAMNKSYSSLDSALAELDKMGVKASPDEIVNALNSKIAELESHGGTMGDARKLQGLKEDIVAAMKGEEKPLSWVEAEKRTHGNVDWTDPEKAAAQKGTYRSLMDLVEEKGGEASPRLLDQFKKAKETYGLLSPIQEASQKRALQLQQSPVLGLLDLASLGMGAAYGGDSLSEKGLGSVGGLATRRVLAPRLAASGAKTLDWGSKILSGMSPAARSALIGALISGRESAK